jgi:purine-nucleoside phosphorylase
MSVITEDSTAMRIPGAEHAHRGDAVRAAAEAVRVRVGGSPPFASVAIILGTGLGALGRAIKVEETVEYADIPGFPLSTVESHAGRLLLGTLGSTRVMAMQGRFHRYEGYSLQQVTFPVRVLQALGATTLIVSNACGGMRSDWAPGDLMLITDHLNMLGDNPLVGPNDDSLGPRFPDMSEPYSAELCGLARTVAEQKGILLREGVYVAVAGPNLETRAEYRMLRALGADVVGMSTVPEVIVAKHGGMRTLGVSIITDMCIPETLEPASLEKILKVAARAEPNLTALVTGVVDAL